MRSPGVMSMMCVVAMATTAPSESSELHYVQRARAVGPTANGPYQVRMEHSTFIRMRDGVRLSTDLYFPEGLSGQLPVILRRTPYDKGNGNGPDNIWKFFASHGYVVAQQDLRGKYESEGTFFAYQDEGDDGYDTVSWLAQQPWSNGRIGTFGCSYEGEVQHMLARRRHPNHKAAVIQGDSAFQGYPITGLGFRQNGAIELAAALSWNVESGSGYYYGPPAGVDRQNWFRSPWAKLYRVGYEIPSYDPAAILRELPIIGLSDRIGAPPNEFRNWVKEPPGSAYWRRQGGFTARDRFAVPALHMTSWYDFTFSPSTAFEIYKKNAVTPEVREQQYLLIGPGTHCKNEQLSEHTIVGARDLGDARYDLRGLYLDWFDHWLKQRDSAATAQPKVQFYVMGDGHWRGADEWPPKGAVERRYYLHSGGHANTRYGDGRLETAPPGAAQPADTLTYDPGQATPTRGGAICCTGGNEIEGPVDVADIEMRQDTLVYTTEALAHPVEITGPVSVELYVSSDAPDTDFVARLSEVDAEGRSWVLLDGIMRMRYSQGLDREIRMQPGQVYRFSLDLQATSIRIRSGHRIRLDIASAGFPRWDRNLNTGGNNFDEVRWRVARNSVHHDPNRRSSLSLSIMPAAQGTKP